MSAEHQRSFLELLQDAETMVANLDRSLTALNGYVQAAFDNKENAAHKSGLLPTKLFITKAQETASHIANMLSQTRTDKPEYLD